MPIPRKRPYPYDMIFAGLGVMNGQPKKGAPLVTYKPSDQANVVASDYGYNAQSPILEKVFRYNDFSMGMGLSEQEEPNGDPRYDHALNVDASIHGAIVPGPKLYSVQGIPEESVNAASGLFFELTGLLHCAIGGNLITRITDENWSASTLAFGAGYWATGVLVHKQNDVGVAAYAYITATDGADTKFCRFDGVNPPAVHMTLTGIDIIQVGDEVWRAHSVNKLAKCDTLGDPWDPADWGADYYIGDASSPITRLAISVTGSLLVFKTDGIYSLDAAGNWFNLFPFLRTSPAAHNGNAWGSFLGDVYTTFGDSVYKIDPNYAIESVGPDTMLSNRSEVHGRVTAYEGNVNMGLYAALYNPDSGNSYLLKYGGWREDKAGHGVRLPVWHGSLSPELRGQVVAMRKSSMGAATGHSRLYMADTTGAIWWFTLPCTANPLACDDYEFSSAPGYLFLPVWTGGFGSDVKSLRAVTVDSLYLSGTGYVELEYAADNVGAWTAMPQAFTVSPRKKVSFEEGLDATRFAMRLKFTSSASNAPKIRGFGLHYSLRTDLLQVLEFDVLCDRGLVDRKGARLRVGAPRIREVLQNAAASPDAVEIITADEERKIIYVVGYSEGVSWDQRTKSWKSSVRIQATESRSNVIQGTYGILERYTYGELESFTYGQLETL
jgi:hypothetical protein